MLPRFISGIIIVLILLSGCATPGRLPAFDLASGKPSLDTVVARVNREPITFAEWNEAYENFGKENKYSEAEFLNEYIKYKIGAQKGRKLKLDAHPKINYAKEVAICNKFLQEQFKIADAKIPFIIWKNNYLNDLKNSSYLWIDPRVSAVGVSSLKENTVIARVNSETITVYEFTTLFREERKRYSDKLLLNKYLSIKLINELAVKGGWLEVREKAFINVAEDIALFDMVNKIEFGTKDVDKKRVKKLYNKERERSDVEIYSSSFLF